ncbi:NAD-dependent epimerase/dehydratase family protein [Ramlibacter humi]|uniref:NAD-dependent epimerase/dehydratase family protein n=1 Tax=Ramlibacter humi TaxID=2530451 RepID=A0A4Z0BZ82_9BURK|nr:NAD-dependent epimerase/dehydratase family protein [Ramlibacter humi]TFZ03854.1 NAD-dependent epimerase/dehydratase family protein [Ramlibacter humi]
MPSIQSPLGALPSRFRRERVLIVGCGDVGLRVARQLGSRVRLLALTSSPARVEELRALGIVPLGGNLDDARTLAKLAGLATRVVQMAPPPGDGWGDPRTRALLAALQRRSAPAALVYGSTTGVYGDCGGERIDETRGLRARTPRALRRVDAENAVRHYERQSGARTAILRIPGIYAPDRAGGTPRERLLKGLPVLQANDDAYTNHIHADDLARATVAALWRARPLRALNVVDDSELKMGDYYDLAADLYGLPRPRRVSREEAAATLPAATLSFMGESRRLSNTRLKRELRVRLRYPTVREGLAGS